MRVHYSKGVAGGAGSDWRGRSGQQMDILNEKVFIFLNNFYIIERNKSKLNKNYFNFIFYIPHY